MFSALLNYTACPFLDVKSCKKVQIAEHQSSFNLIHYEIAFKADMIICKSRACNQIQLNRRRLSAIASDPEESVYVTSPEDTILSKLEWDRVDGEVSDRQWRDTPSALGAQNLGR